MGPMGKKRFMRHWQTALKLSTDQQRVCYVWPSSVMYAPLLSTISLMQCCPLVELEQQKHNPYFRSVFGVVKEALSKKPLSALQCTKSTCSSNIWLFLYLRTVWALNQAESTCEVSVHKKGNSTKVSLSPAVILVMSSWTNQITARL